MAIKRVSATIARTQELPYTTFLNSTIELISDPDALAIYAYLQTKNAGWIVRREDVMKKFNIGKHRYTKAMGYLRDIGLVGREIKRDKEGKVIDNQLVIHYEPEPATRSTDSPDTGSIGNPDERESGELGHLETDQSFSNVSSNTNNSSVPPGGGTCEICNGTEVEVGFDVQSGGHIEYNCSGCHHPDQPTPKQEKPKRIPKWQQLVNTVRGNPEKYPALNCIDDELMEEWAKLRTKRNASSTERALTTIESTLEALRTLHRIAPDTAIAEQCNAGWSTVKVEYFVRSNGVVSQNIPQQPQTGWSAGLENEVYRGKK